MAFEKKHKKVKKISPKYLENSGLAYLQRFSASSKHFEKIMMRKINRSVKAHPEQNIDECKEWLSKLIEQFQTYDYLNDDAYAKSLAKTLRYKGHAYNTILYKMSLKGIDRDVAKTYLDKADQETIRHTEDIQNADFISALRLCKKRRIGPFRNLEKDDENTHRKSLGAMARAGYGYDIATKALETSKDEAMHILLSAY